MVRRKEPVIPDSILDQLLNGADAKTVFESNGLLDQLKKALAERVLNAEMDHHLSADEQVVVVNKDQVFYPRLLVEKTGRCRAPVEQF